MKKFLFLLAIFTASVQGIAQTALNTIQVTVSETVELKAIEYVYTVSNHELNRGSFFGDDYEDDYEYNYNYDEEEDEYKTVVKMPKSITEMSNILQKAKFTCTIIDNSTYDVDAEDDEDKADLKQHQVIEIRVTSLSELKRLSSEVAKIDDAYGQITDVNYENLSSKYEKLYPKLMEDARNKAKALASAANKTVGNVVQIEEGSGGPSIFGSQWESYLEKMMSMRDLFGSASVEHSEEVVVSMTYTFELK